MSTAKRVIKNTGFLYAKMGITMFISLYTTRLVLNALGVSDFGVFNIVGGIIAMLGFLNASMASATQRFMSYSEGEGNKEKQKKIFNISIVLHFLIGCVLGLVLLIIGYFFFNGVLNIESSRIYAAKVVYGSLIFSTIFTVMTVPYDAVINAHENMLYYAIVGIVESILKLFAALTIVYFGGDKLMLYGILMACIPLIIMTIMRVYCHRKYEECILAPRKYWDKRLMKEMRSFAGWNFFGTSIAMITNYGQGIIINMFFGTIVNAAQAIANQIAGQLMFFSNSMIKALNPVIVKREGSGNRKDMLDIAITGGKFSFALLAFFAIPVIFEMPHILRIWLKNVPDYAVVFCQLLLVRMLIEQMVITLPTSIAATGNIKRYQIVISLMALIPLFTTCFFFYLGFKPIVLYIVYIVHVLIRSFAVIPYFAQRQCNLNIKNFFLKVIMKEVLVVLLSVAIAFIPFFSLKADLLRLALIAFTFATSFLCLFYGIGLNSKERDIINKLYFKLKERLL